MPHLDTTLTLVGGPVVAPIVGNDNIGGACYDGAGQALYATFDAGAFKVYRTRGGYEALRDIDASVDYLSTILTATPKIVRTSTALQMIGGVAYATISAWLSDGNAGNWIYRDTGGGGVGPWVLHGTVQAISGATGTDSIGMTLFTSEILVLPGGTWVTNSPVWYAYNNTGTMRRGGVFTSGDGGATWTKRLDAGWHILNGAFGIAWSRNFGKFNGAWYVGGLGNVEDGQHFKSTDCVSWTSIGSLGAGNSYGYSFPISDPQWIYRWSPGGDTVRPRLLQSAADAPEASPLWANILDTTPLPFYVVSTADNSFPLLCNIGPDKVPLWVASNFGQILSIGTTPSTMPPCRQYPREDGLGTSSARRIFPQPRSQQGGLRLAGGTYY